MNPASHQETESRHSTWVITAAPSLAATLDCKQAYPLGNLPGQHGNDSDLCCHADIGCGTSLIRHLPSPRYPLGTPPPLIPLTRPTLWHPLPPPAPENPGKAPSESFQASNKLSGVLRHSGIALRITQLSLSRRMSIHIGPPPQCAVRAAHLSLPSVALSPLPLPPYHASLLCLGVVLSMLTRHSQYSSASLAV